MSEVAFRTPYAEVCAEIGERETEPLVLRKLAQNPATPQTTQRRLLESPAWEYLLDNPNVSGETLTEIWEKLRHSSPAGVDTEDDILAHPNCPDRLAEEICDSAFEEARIDH